MDEKGARHRVAIIGCGRPRGTEGATGFGMAHAHARGYLQTGHCDIVAVADISRENAEAFAAEYDGPDVYLDYEAMLAEEKPDVVSITTWPHLHAPMVIAAAEAGVRAIHCEKPMAPTWGEARRMADVCAARGAQLTFNHQRRFLMPFQTARRLLREGDIGELRRIEGTCSDLYDWGTHWFDMFFFYNGEAPAEWVMGQIDLRTGKKIFGVPVEDQGISQVRFRNGVRGLLVTGHDADIGCANRLIGSDGVIEIHGERPHVRVRAKGDADWRLYVSEEGIHGEVAVARGIANLLEALEDGTEPELAGARALQAAELTFATYESSRRRGRVDLPLRIDDSPLVSLLEGGEFGPVG